MHSLTSPAPSGALREVVRAYAQRTTGVFDAEVVQRVPASLEQILEFEFGTLPIVTYWDGTSEPAHRVSIVGAQLPPAQAKRDITTGQARVLLAVSVLGISPGKSRRRIAAEELSELVAVEAKIKEATAELRPSS